MPTPSNPSGGKAYPPLNAATAHKHLEKTVGHHARIKHHARKLADEHAAGTTPPAAEK